MTARIRRAIRDFFEPLSFRQRITVRAVLMLPIILGIILGPGLWSRICVCIGFLLHFFSVEAILAKIRRG